MYCLFLCIWTIMTIHELKYELNKNSDDNASARNEDIMKTKSLHDLTMFKNISFHQGLFLSGLGWEYAVSENDFYFISQVWYSHVKRIFVFLCLNYAMITIFSCF